VPFLDEERHLPVFLASVDSQSRLPDRLLLVDDGSTDGSLEVASTFARGREYAEVVERPPQPRGADRLSGAAEYKAFQWAVARLGGAYDLLAKLDADLDLTPETFAELERRFEANERLGVAGVYLSVKSDDGRTLREPCPPYHVRGATKFYRRRCLEEISPVVPILGWDTIDETAARMRGWRSMSFTAPGGDPIHLRPVGGADGQLRAYRRWGACAWAAGFHPAWVALGAVRRAGRRPLLLGGASYLAGWALAAARRLPRAPADVRAHLRREQLSRIRRAVAGRDGSGDAGQLDQQPA
jgi:biofilm PGA synthesis N-glycosyltransferase PgaC